MLPLSSTPAAPNCTPNPVRKSAWSCLTAYYAPVSICCGAAANTGARADATRPASAWTSGSIRTLGLGQRGSRLLSHAGQRGVRPSTPASGRARPWRRESCRSGAAIGRMTTPASPGQSEALHHDDGKFKSPYADLSSRGADISDRRLFFVETLPHTVAIPGSPTVPTSGRGKAVRTT